MKHYQPKTDATGKPPSVGSNVKPAPKQLGERIPNTDLVRQWQGGREIYPRYIASRPHMMTLGKMCDEAFAQALAAGFKGVWVEGDCYIFRGEWYLWSLPH